MRTLRPGQATVTCTPLRGCNANCRVNGSKLNKRSKTTKRHTGSPAFLVLGPLNATALIAAVGDAQTFARGRDLAAWLGLVPGQATTGGKPRLLGITNAAANIYGRSDSGATSPPIYTKHSLRHPNPDEALREAYEKDNEFRPIKHPCPFSSMWHLTTFSIAVILQPIRPRLALPLQDCTFKWYVVYLSH